MKRRQRTQLMIEYGEQEALRWANQLEERYAIQTIVEPNLGLLMIKQRETAKNSLFYSGEILITECKVRHEQLVGTGIVKGDHEVFAYALAIIDLAFQAEWPEVKAMEEWLYELEMCHQNQLIDLNKRYAQTKVDFSTMNQ